MFVEIPRAKTAINNHKQPSKQVSKWTIERLISPVKKKKKKNDLQPSRAEVSSPKDVPNLCLQEEIVCLLPPSPKSSPISVKSVRKKAFRSERNIQRARHETAGVAKDKWIDGVGGRRVGTAQHQRQKRNAKEECCKTLLSKKIECPRHEPHTHWQQCVLGTRSTVMPVQCSNKRWVQVRTRLSHRTASDWPTVQNVNVILSGGAEERGADGITQPFDKSRVSKPTQGYRRRASIR